MSPFAELLIKTAGQLPLEPMKSYADVIKVLQRAAVVVDRQEKEIMRLRETEQYQPALAVTIPHKGYCT
jgi:hypothetical protein